MKALRRLLAMVRQRRLDQELDGEILAHLELAERDALARGLSPDAARREARLSFGGIAQMKDEHRDGRGFPLIENLFRDLRYGLLSLWRAPAFTAVVVSVLALGIGANVAMFSVVDAVMLKPIPFTDPDRLVRVWEAPRPGSSNSTTAPEFLEWKRSAEPFEALSAERPIAGAFSDQGDPIRLPGKAVTGDYFQVFGVGAVLGRTFSAEEEGPAIVLSHAAWKNHFASDPAILTRRPVVDGVAHQIIGVLREGAFDRDRTQFWRPLIFTPAERASNSHWLQVYGRLRPGATLAMARERMQVIHAASQKLERESVIMVEPLARLLVGAGFKRMISVAFGAVGLVLLIACANVANLLLAKGATRRRELAIRASLGASRGRLVAQLLTESVLLCLLGGAAGLALAASLISVAAPWLASNLPFTAAVSLDLRVLAFAAAIALSVAVFTSILPAWQTGAVVRGHTPAHTRLRRLIVVAEVALSLVLLCGALLLFRSLLKLQNLDTGVRIENVITTSVDLPAGAYGTPQSAAVFYETAVQRLLAAPGVTQIGLSTHLPMEWIGNGEGLQIPGSGKFVNVRLKRVDPGYFRALDIPLRQGRGITAQDRDGAPFVIVINEALAARLPENPIGKTFRLTAPSYLVPREFMPEVQVVGIIRSERTAAPGLADPLVVYLPLAQLPSTHVKLIVRSNADAAMPAIREAIRDVDPRLPLGEVATMAQVRSRTLVGASTPAWLIGIFAAVAVLLSAIGLYGVLSQAVTQQRREIGIRMALGAQPSDVLRHVLRNAMTMVAVGLGLGLLGAFGLTRVMEGLLFEVSPLDPLALATACGSMVLIGLLAGFLPANRAARVDPVTTLREEG